jgi:hypothetical protein
MEYLPTSTLKLTTGSLRVEKVQPIPAAAFLRVELKVKSSKRKLKRKMALRLQRKGV